MKDLNITSTAPVPSWADNDAVGMAWRVYVHKPQGRPAYATALEGARTARGSFQTCHPGSRTVPPVPIVGPATLKKKKAALLAVLDQLRARDAITAEDFTAAIDSVYDATVIEA